MTLFRLIGRLLLILGFCATTLAGRAEAQVSIGTAIVAAPLEGGNAAVFNTDRRVTLVFQTGALPANARVTGASLRLVAAGLLDSADVTIDASVVGAAGDTKFGSRSFGRGEPVNDTEILWTADPDAAWFPQVVGGRAVEIRITLEPAGLRSGVQTRQWYAPTASNAAQRPRLLLEYMLEDRVAPVQSVGLSGIGGAALFMPSPAWTGNGGQVAVRRFAPDDTWSEAPAFYNGIVFHVVGKNAAVSLEARRPLGELVWTLPVPDAGRFLVLGPGSRLYLVGSERVRPMLLDPTNPLARPSAPFAADGKPQLEVAVPGLKPEGTPKIGPDGSLFLINGGHVVGLSADFKQLWSVPLGDRRVSPITVGPSGRYVYLTSAADGLIALDARTGAELRAALGAQASLKAFDAPALFAPVVLRVSDGTEKVYVAANAGARGSLTLFDNSMTRADALSPGLAQQWTQPGIWSQPLPGLTGSEVMGMILVVREEGGQGRATGLDLFNGTTITLGSAVDIGDGSIFAGNRSPVIDARRTLYFWNGSQGELVALPPSDAAASSAQAASLPTDARLLLGSEGTMYAENPDDRALTVLVPKIVMTGQPDAVFQGRANLVLGGRGGPRTVIQAAGSVILEPGSSLANDTRVMLRRR